MIGLFCCLSRLLLPFPLPYLLPRPALSGLPRPCSPRRLARWGGKVPAGGGCACVLPGRSRAAVRRGAVPPGFVLPPLLAGRGALHCASLSALLACFFFRSFGHPRGYQREPAPPPPKLPPPKPPPMEPPPPPKPPSPPKPPMMGPPPRPPKPLSRHSRSWRRTTWPQCVQTKVYSTMRCWGVSPNTRRSSRTSVCLWQRGQRFSCRRRWSASSEVARKKRMTAPKM